MRCATAIIVATEYTDVLTSHCSDHHIMPKPNAKTPGRKELSSDTLKTTFWTVTSGKVLGYSLNAFA